LAEQETRHHASQIAEIDLILPSEVFLQVRIFDLDLYPDEASLVNAAEVKRANGFFRASDRRHFLARRSILRSVLVEHSGLEECVIDLDSVERGKPCLPSGAPLRFNASRSDRWLAVVLTESAIEPGIDIEFVRKIPDVSSVSRRILSLEESHALGEEYVFDSRRLLRVWTRKEAVLKSIGTGLGIDPSQVTVPIEADLSMGGGATVRNGTTIHDVMVIEPELDFDELLLSVGVAEQLVDPVSH
jgi:4'-phosphopantetheinyl transferase